MARTTTKDLQAQIDKLTEALAAQTALLAKLTGEPVKEPASQSKPKAKSKAPEKPTGPFAEMSDKAVRDYLIRVFQARNRDTGIWLYSEHVGRKRAVWNMAHHLVYLPGYSFSAKAAEYAKAILAGDKRNLAVLDAMRKAKK